MAILVLQIQTAILKTAIIGCAVSMKKHAAIPIRNATQDTIAEMIIIVNLKQLQIQKQKKQ